MLSYAADPKTVEEKVKIVYQLLTDLSEIEDFPALRQNSNRALATVWQIVNHLGLEFEQLDALGIQDKET